MGLSSTGELRILVLEWFGWRPGSDLGGHVRLSSTRKLRILMLERSRWRLGIDQRGNQCGTNQQGGAQDPNAIEQRVEAGD